jgi:hypothetical protein
MHTLRVAKTFVRVLREVAPSRLYAPWSLIQLRGIAMRLQAIHVRPQDLDQPNGHAAIIAVLQSMTEAEVVQLASSNSLTLSARWARVVNHAHAEISRVM